MLNVRPQSIAHWRSDFIKTTKYVYLSFVTNQNLLRA